MIKFEAPIWMLVIHMLAILTAIATLGLYAGWVTVFASWNLLETLFPAYARQERSVNFAAFLCALIAGVSLAGFSTLVAIIVFPFVYFIAMVCIFMLAELSKGTAR